MLIIAAPAVVGNNIHTPWVKLAVLGSQDISRLELEGSGIKDSPEVEVMSENENPQLYQWCQHSEETGEVWTESPENKAPRRGTLPVSSRNRNSSYSGRQGRAFLVSGIGIFPPGFFLAEFTVL